MIYLDHAATAPLTDAARTAWENAAAMIGNPSSLHAAGRATRATVEEARERIAAGVGAEPAEVVFTSGGTEADNLAVLGIARARREADPRRNVVLVSAVEHHAVLEPAHHLRAEGFRPIELPADPDGRVNLGFARAAFEEEPDTVALLSVQWVNNETGAIQPVAALSALAREYGVPFHSDAVQAPAYNQVSLSGLDALSLSGHKLGGPVGIGALVARRNLPIDPVTFGGGQERRLRSGTVPAALIAGFAAALGEAVREREAETARLAGLSAKLVAGLTAVEGVRLVGPVEAQGRSPHIVNVLVHGALGEDLLLLLDDAGIACSTGAACTAGVAQPSHVLIALGYPAHQEARWGLRFSLGRTTTAADIGALLDVFPGVVERARAAGAA